MRMSFVLGLAKRHVARQERGFALVFFVLLLIPLVGLTALVLDIGMFSLARQRTLLATDMAALASNDLLYRGADESPVQEYARHVVAANFTAWNGYSQANWNTLRNATDVDIESESDAAQITVSKSVAFNTYFSGIFSHHVGTSDVHSAAAFDTGEYRTGSLHLVLLLETMPNLYGSGPCSTLGITCRSPSEREYYCEPGCASRIDAALEQIKILSELLGDEDRLSLIAYGDFAEAMLSGFELTREGTEDLHTILDTEYMNWWSKVNWTPSGLTFPMQYEPHYYFRNNPSRALDLALKRLKESESSTDRTAIVLLARGAIPWGDISLEQGGEVGETAWGDTEYYGGEAAVEWKTHLEAEYGEELERLREGECSNNYQACLSYWSSCRWGDPNRPKCQQTKEKCLRNPVKFYEQVSGIIASKIQEEHFAPIYTIGFGESDADLPYEEVGLYHPWAEPSREQNFLLELSNDQSQPRVGTPVRLDCGVRPPKQQGRHFSPKPTGYELLKTARELLQLARRGEDAAIDDDGFSPRWVNPG